MYYTTLMLLLVLFIACRLYYYTTENKEVRYFETISSQKAQLAITLIETLIMCSSKRRRRLWWCILRTYQELLFVTPDFNAVAMLPALDDDCLDSHCFPCCVCGIFLLQFRGESTRNINYYLFFIFVYCVVSSILYLYLVVHFPPKFPLLIIPSIVSPW